MSKLLSFKDWNSIEAGCDEAGRGCLAGPVVAAAVILPKDFKNEILNDSKKLSEAKRNLLRPIVEKEAIAFGVSFVFQEEIDEINILNASFMAMHRAVDQLKERPDSLLIDGNRFNPYPEISHDCIIKGDGKYLSIAAASILAKTYRDEYMKKIHNEFPMYDWINNKGYPTKKHRRAILEHGDCKHHRRTFTLLPADQSSLFD
ncbi:MAG: ribonuclease HII [Crocinitomicaceae bacterium]|nr:ribonuclease HII [Crocinitomicaceae bacterium]